MPTVAEIESPKYRISSIAVDNVIFVNFTGDSLEAFKGWHDDLPDQRGEDPTETGWHVLLITRKNPPYQGSYCLPGGFVDYGEDPNDAAPRELKEETHISPELLPSMTLVGVYGEKNRDPRRHVISIAYGCILRPDLARVAHGGDDAKTATLVPVRRIFAQDVTLGFDHLKIVVDAFQKIVNKVG